MGEAVAEEFALGLKYLAWWPLLRQGALGKSAISPENVTENIARTNEVPGIN
ncbi:hypothetical protein [Gymnodinialimonas ceratoperidinii]|uniref:Uncharacterized protein n=1 Tax=Gymnodinialimonas ceratoperidinii TaxID=2856823 RepID=A0A8F6TVL5_9RHOB|nr:hypothetical protein [Gymnodinialimonas ceratoperidinii]QXT39004.1 hypothetical protein KYE46_13855 [Gymnodinialimonas ceratoperidinii]